MAVSDRRHLLRNRTAAAHAALDEAVGPLDNLDSYRRYLRGLHAFRVPAERLVAAGLAERSAGLDGVAPKGIVELMRADMAELGVAPTAPVALEPVGGVSSLLGLIYVLEGSALGARLLKRQAAAIGLGAENGAAHLAAQAESLESWNGFLGALDALPDYNEDEAVAFAEAAFAAALSAFAELDATGEDAAVRA